MYDFRINQLLESLSDSKILDVPENVIVLNHNSGEIETKEKKKMSWGSLVVASNDEYEALKGIGMEERAGHIKVTLKGYNGEDLTPLINKVIPTSAFTLDFETQGQYKTIIGAKFIGNLEDIELV